MDPFPPFFLVLLVFLVFLFVLSHPHFSLYGIELIHFCSNNSEFCEFLELHVVGTEEETSRRRGGGGGGNGGGARGQGQTVVLGLERALHVYAKQQIKAHQVHQIRLQSKDS